MSMEMLVEEMVEKHGGGRRFFDSLDYKLRSNAIVSALTVMSYAMFGQKKIVVSGQFGEEYAKKFYPTLVLPSLSHGSGTLYLVDAEGEYVFLDDSFYSGKTYEAAQMIVRLGGGRIVGAVVAYDGAPYPQRGVYSLYRWRDR